MACVCHTLAACQRHTPSALAAVIGLSNNDVISSRFLRCVRCVGWKPGFNRGAGLGRSNIDVVHSQTCNISRRAIVVDV